MMINEYIINYYNNDLIVSTNNKELFIEKFKNYHQIDKGFNHLNGSEELLVQVLFVDNKNKKEYKSFLNNLINKENISYYVEKETTTHTIFICNPNQKIEEKISDFSVLGNKITVLEFFASSLNPILKDVKCTHIPNYQQHESQLQNKKIVNNNSITSQQLIKFYSLFMDNIMLNVLKDKHSKNLNTAYELYLYEKVRVYENKVVNEQVSTNTKSHNKSTIKTKR